MKKKIVSILLVVIMTFLLAACGNNDTSDSNAENSNNNDGTKELTEITFVLDWTPNTNHTGLYVAEKNGYFEEAGLKVNIVQPPEGGAELLIASEEAEFAVSFQDSMMPAIVGENALPIEAVAAIRMRKLPTDIRDAI